MVQQLRRWMGHCTYCLHISFVSILAMVPVFSSAQTVTNLYHTNRVFKPIEFTNMGSSITAYEAYTMIHRLTTVVGPTNIVTNAIWATEYEGLSWCLPSAESAWACVLSKYPYTTKCTSNHIYDNAGWIKGTKSLDGEWGGFLWLQQNSVDFRSSETNIWVSTNGITNLIVKVLVGSIGDYPPMTNVVDVGPTDWANITNCPGAGVSTEAVYRADFTTYYQVINPLLIPDYDHNRVIDGWDRSKAVQNEVFHFWKNDDDDAGDLEGNDIPGDGTADSSDLAVDGTRDLIDWFPVYLDLKPTLEAFDGLGYKYVLATLETNEFNVIFSQLKPWESGKYLTDLSNANATVSAVVQTINSNGYQLTTAFLDGIMNDDKGIILVEGRYSTSQPLQLRILNATNGVVLIKDMPLQISGVEEMYRWINLRNVASGAVTRATDITEPSNNPDSLCNGKSFVFVHGYSVSEEQARGWNAEVFKRLYQTGSHAKFYAATWYGNDTQQSWLGGLTPDYHVNVVHALDTADAFANLLNTQVGGDITLATHSLGNMLSSSAITKYSANVSRFFMIDAAVAIETFDGSLSLQNNNMWHTDWDSFSESLWCSEWYTNFPASDGRHALTWRDYFGSGASVAYNFYSSGEDVLETHPHTTYPGLWCVFGGDYAWALQEKRKGLNWISSIGGSTYGGWGFNDYYWDYDLSAYVPPTNAQAILSRPFFRPGGSELEDLYVPTDTNLTDVGSAYATDHLRFLLAGFIPSRTLPIGANHVQRITDVGGGNFNMQTLFENGWPQARLSNPDLQNRWLHSDLRSIAYLYVYKLYDEFKDLGGLGQ